MKSAFFVLCFIASIGAAAPALAAGTLPLAMAQQIDVNGQPLASCQVNFYVAGTVATRQNVFSDFGLTQALGNPLSCDQTGRIPMFWLADGLIHVQLTDAGGVPIIDTTMQVLGPSSGGGGGGTTVDPTTLLATGDLKARYGTGALTGFVRLNNLTVGNGSSGATERANADTQNLFVFLCQGDPNLVMVGGRSGNCLNDFNANKQLTLPDWRGRGLGALDDMGNTPAGRLTPTYFGAFATVLGAAGGSEFHLLTTGEMPAHAHTYTDPGHLHTTDAGAAWAGTSAGSIQNGTGAVINLPVGTRNLAGDTTTNSITAITINNAGGSSPHNIASPMLLTTFYIKL